MKMMNYTEARKDAMDFRQYLARRVRHADLMGWSNRDFWHVRHCVAELAKLTGLSQAAIKEDLAADVAVIEALEELAEAS